jgi:hypothetical protein
MPNFNLVTAFSLFAIAGSQLSLAQRTAANSRLLATATSTLNGGAYVPSDSTSYVYSSAYSANYSSVTLFGYAPGITPRLQSLYTYDAAGRMLSTELSGWNSSINAFIKSARQLFSYASNGLLINEQYQNWNNAKSVYINARQTLYTRNVNGNISNQRDQVWDAAGSSWLDAQTTINTYNAANLRTGSRVDTYSPGNGLTGSSRHDYTYDAGGTVLLSDTFRKMDLMTSVWQDALVLLYANNSSGKPVSVIRLDRNATSGKLDSSQRLTYTYSGDNRTSETTETWAPGTSWQYFSQDEYSFNGDNQLSLYTRSLWNSGAFNPPAIRIVYYYERFTPAAVTPGGGSMPSVTISPNPAVDAAQITISGNGYFTARLIDLQGRVHQKFSGSAGSGFSQNISLAAMPAGTYVLNVQSLNGGNVARMLTVVR